MVDRDRVLKYMFIVINTYHLHNKKIKKFEKRRNRKGKKKKEEAYLKPLLVCSYRYLLGNQ